MLILGVDPGTVALGYGLVSAKGNAFSVLEYGVLPTVSEKKRQTPPPPVKIVSEDRSTGLLLKGIFQGIGDVISRYRPDVIAIEKLFLTRNTKSAMEVGQARGVVILAAAEADLSVVEFTPMQVKMAVTGYGKADKKQVQYMVRSLLGLEETPEPDDAADALAVAMCAQYQLASGIWRHA